MKATFISLKFALPVLLALGNAGVSALPIDSSLVKRQGIFGDIVGGIKNALFSTEKITGSRIIQGKTLEQALPLVQDPEVILSLNPILLSKTQNPTDPLKFTITEKLALGPFQSSTKFDARFVIEGDGLSSIVSASAGVDLNGRWSVKAVEGGVELVEDTTVKAPSPLMSFVIGTAKKSHAESLEALAKKIEAVQ